MTLGFAAFLAVYREGAETVLFYQALVGQSDNSFPAIGLGFIFASIALIGLYTDKILQTKLATTVGKMQILVDTAEKGEAYDQMIAEGNETGNAKVQAAIDALMAQAKALEKALPALGLSNIKFEGSDSLDNPKKVGVEV